MKKVLSIILCLTLCVGVMLGSVGVASADQGYDVNADIVGSPVASVYDTFPDLFENNPSARAVISNTLEDYPYVFCFSYATNYGNSDGDNVMGKYCFVFSDNPWNYISVDNYSSLIAVPSGTRFSTVCFTSRFVEISLSDSYFGSPVFSGDAYCLYRGVSYWRVSVGYQSSNGFLGALRWGLLSWYRHYDSSVFFNWDIMNFYKSPYSVLHSANITSTSDVTDSIGLSHYLSGTNYVIAWNKAKFTEYEILRSTIYIDVMYNNISYELSLNVNNIANSVDISGGKFSIPVSYIKAELAQQIAHTRGDPENPPDVSELQEIKVTSFTVKFSDSDGTLTEKSYNYNDKVLDLKTGALIDSSKLDENYNETPSQLPDYDGPVDSFDDVYADTSLRHFLGSNSQISGEMVNSLCTELDSEGLPYLCVYVSDIEDATTIRNWSNFGEAVVSLDAAGLLAVIIDLVKDDYVNPISELDFYRYCAIFWVENHGSSDNPVWRFYFCYTPLYFQRYLSNLVRLEDVNANLGSLVKEVHSLYKIEYLQYDALYTMYKMQEAELLRQTDYLRSVDSTLSDLNSRYFPFDDTEVLEAIRAVSFDLDGQAIEDAIVSALSKITVTVSMPDDPGGGDDGGIVDSLLPEWLVELKNFVKLMVTGDGSSFDYLVKLFTFFTDSGSGFYIDSDADGTILDEWKGENTWSP